MKMMLLMLAVAAGLLCGCKPDAATEKRLTEMEQRQNKQREDLQKVNELLGRTLMMTEELAATNREMSSMMISNTLMVAELAVGLQEQTDSMMAVLTNKAAVAARAAMARQERLPGEGRPTLTAAGPRGVPGNVYQQIASEAQRRFPNDFEMQEFVIKQQVESYRKLHP